MDSPFEHRLRVRYGETDQMGVVHHPNYLHYMEEARTAYLAALGRPYSELERGGVGLVVRRVELRFGEAFPTGRTRINCTVPAGDGRWYWFGHQFYRAP